MALLATTKPFHKLRTSNHSLTSPLPKPTAISPHPLSFQCHANSGTFPTVSATTHLPKSPIFSFNRAHSSFPVASPHNRGQRFQSPRAIIDDDSPPTLNEDEWGNAPKRLSNISDDKGENDPKSGEKNPQNGEANSPPGNVGGADSAANGSTSNTYVDEWGEKIDPDDESAQTMLPDADPPSMEDDEWGAANDQSPKESDSSAEDSGLAGLKRCLVDCFYGTEYGLRASSQIRAEIGELISQLEAQNPTPVPTEALSLLQGKWVLVYTSFSELLPLIAAGTLPFVKLEKICQEIDIDKFTIENSASYSGPFATFSFRALASFEVRSPKRIQVKFEEGIIPPPEIASTVDIPEKVEIFGQKIDLTSFLGTSQPLQEAATSISRVISGQPPIKLPIGRDGAQSWLLISYLDEDLRISRGDGGGLFVLVKEGSSLLSL